MITDKDKQMGRWVEHCLDLYSRENSVIQEVLDKTEDLPAFRSSTLNPLWKGFSDIDALTRSRASGNNALPAEIIKCRQSALLEPIHELLYLCWR